MTFPDTIVALSSSPGAASRAVVRFSGAQALDVAAGICGVPVPRARGCVRGAVAACGGEVPVLLLAMPGPRSYTREDVAEIHLPGAAPLAAEVLRRAAAAGAREARPGEFTRRALLNGRIGIGQAEAVMDAIRARSDAELRRAAERMAGRGGRALAGVSDALASLLADVEASIDFVEHDIPCVGRAEILERISGIMRALEAAPSGAAAPDDVPRVLLAGPPNAGKTSLFNALTGSRALVSPRPGTTRDVLEGEVRAGPVTFRLLDAPGDGDAPSGPEAAAVLRARGARDRADLVLHVRDGSRPFSLPSLDPARELVVLSKSDLAAPASAARGYLRVSSITGAGLGRLRARAAAAVRRLCGAADSALSSRELDASRRAREALERARSAADADLGEEFVAGDLREALNALGEVTGEVATEELLDRIFARFCIGK